MWLVFSARKRNVLFPKNLTQDCVASVPLRIDCCTKKTNYILEKEPILAFAFQIHASQKVNKVVKMIVVDSTWCPDGRILNSCGESSVETSPEFKNI